MPRNIGVPLTVSQAAKNKAHKSDIQDTDVGLSRLKKSIILWICVLFVALNAGGDCVAMIRNHSVTKLLRFPQLKPK